MIKRNITLFKINGFFDGLFPLSALFVVYFESITNSYATAMLVFSTSFIIQSIMEIPAGIYSDKIGRKKTLILSGFLFVLSALLWALAGTFDYILLLFIGAVLFGISDAFLSGTDEALMYETMEELGDKRDFSVLFSRYNFWNQVGLGSAAISAAFITYYFDMVVLAWISCLPILGSLIVACFYIEPAKLTKTHEINSLSHFVKAFKEIIKNRKLMFFSSINIISNSLGMTSHRFELAYFATLVPIWVVTVAKAFKQICGGLGFFIVPRLKKYSTIKILFTSLIASSVIKIISVLMNTFVTPFLMSISNLFYGPSLTSNKEIMQKEFTSEQRATMGSIIAFIKGIATGIFMYIFGLIADFTSPMICVLLLAIIQLLVKLGFVAGVKNKRKFYKKRKI